jgi:hypothetical protein
VSPTHPIDITRIQRQEDFWERQVSRFRLSHSLPIETLADRSTLPNTGGWRWVAALVAILSGSLTIVGTRVSRETYAPVLLQKRAKLLSEYTGLVYRYKGTKTEVQAAQLFKVALSKPWKLLFREPIVMLLSL